MTMWTSALTWCLLTGPVTVVFGITLWNVWRWTRGRALSLDQLPKGERRADGSADLSVLIPARNEQDTIESCVRSAADGEIQPKEIIVYDDRSDDDTRQILERLAEEFDQSEMSADLKILDGVPLPDGWIGKPHACHKLAQAASGRTLVFVDADTHLKREGVGRLYSLLMEGGPGPVGGADIVTAVPRQRMIGWGERLMMPLLHLTYTSWLPQDLVYRSDDPRFLAANGQVMAMRHRTLESMGGFESVRREVVDDMAMVRQVKTGGGTVVFADGYDMAECRMYDSTSELIGGFSKNLYEGIGSTVTALLGVIGLYVVTFLLPYVGFGVTLIPGVNELMSPAIWPASIVGVMLNTSIRIILAFRFGHPMSGVVLHPLAILGFIGIAINSCLWHLKDTVHWSGRTYSARSNR